MAPMIDIQKIIQSLNSIDISKIDAAAILAVISKRRDILISLLLIIVTLIFVRHIFISANQKKNASQNELTLLEEKQKTALILEEKQKELAKLAENIPNGFPTETEVIKAVVGIVEKHGVKVLFYNPKDAKIEEHFSVQTVDFIFESTYGQMLDAIKSIEQSKTNLQINFWKNSTANTYQYNSRNAAKKDDTDTLRWEISVSSIKVKK